MSGSRAENGSSRNQISGSTASAAGDTDALLLAAGQFPRIIGFAPFQADQFDHLAGTRFALRLTDPLDLQWEGHIAEHGHMRQQGEVLEHHAHLVAANLDQLAFGRLQEVAALEQNGAGGRLDQPRHAAHDCRFAGPGKAHDDEDLALVDIEGGVAHRTDQAGGADLVGAGHVRTAGKKAFSAVAEQLPHAAAG